MDPEIEDAAEDMDSDEEGMAITQALLEAFEEAAEDVDLLVAEKAVLTFAVMATHMLLYDVVEMTDDASIDVQKLSEEWLIDGQRFFTDGIANETLLRQIGEILERPQLAVKLNRQFRRRLTGR
jgi:hypothetical protein